MNLSVEERVFILCKTAAAINLYYAHGQDAEEFESEAALKDLIPKALSAKDRYEFALIMMEFIARLRNAHSWYVDDQVRELFGQPLGFRLGWSDKAWRIENSQVEELKPGDIVKAVSGEEIESFFSARKRYLPVSSERQARTKLSEAALLWPEEFNLALADGRTIHIKKGASLAATVTGQWLEDGIGFISIPSFGAPEFELKALEYARQFEQAQAIIIDVRDNIGGATPETLIRYLMDRPYRGWTESTPIHFGLLRFYCDMARQNPAVKPMVEQLLMFNEAQLTWRSPLEQPEPDHYQGRLLILVGPCCRSAGEDFVQPFKETGRAVLVGANTFGSTGQPWFYDFGNGIRIFIGTKRSQFADGTPFEGRGINPDVELTPTCSDLARGKDIVLERALVLAKQPL